MIKYRVKNLSNHRFVVAIDPFGGGLQFGWYGGDNPEEFDRIHHVRTLDDEQLHHLLETITKFLANKKPIVPLIEGELK